ncbi:MAG: class I SAM-dependent methyltransferase [Sulfurovum sp.]
MKIKTKCSICQTTTIEFINDDILYHQCESCEYIFKSPKYYRDFDTQKERYNLHQNEEENEGYIAYFERFLNFVLPLTKSPQKALDFGCGVSSLLSKLLLKNGIECDYYDPIYHPDREYKDKKYDLIVSTEVFEHLHNPNEVFRELLSLLDNNGYLAIQTEFHPNNLEKFSKWYYHKDPTHIVFLRAKTFEVLASKYGGKVIDNNNKNMVVIQKCR